MCPGEVKEQEQSDQSQPNDGFTGSDFHEAKIGLMDEGEIRIGLQWGFRRVTKRLQLTNPGMSTMNMNLGYEHPKGIIGERRAVGIGQCHIVGGMELPSVFNQIDEDILIVQVQLFPDPVIGDIDALG